jgi:hypothetical protein
MSEQKLMAGMYVRIPETVTVHSVNVSKNKNYQVLDVEKLSVNTYFHIIDDTNNRVLCILDKCSFLNNGSWEIVENKLSIALDKLVANKVYQAALYFLAGVSVGYIIFTALS